jgi:lipid-A-disaccharide synthase-like uncharacterized protein
MIIEEWRHFLYPLGILSSLAFAARFLYQWIVSEKQKQSVVTPVFWKISLTGNILLFIHSFIQLQIHVCLVQACNAVISWRNLNLMQPPSQRWARSRVIAVLLCSILFTIIAFLAQGFFLANDGMEWFRIPITPWSSDTSQPISGLWHFVGATGIALFNSRFWIQWWCAEKSRSSYLGPAFWWISLIGDILCLSYFARIGDLINLVGPLFGLPPYIRNLMIIRKSTKNAQLKSPL